MFSARFLMMCEVVGLRIGDERHTVILSDGTEAHAPAVVLSTGVSYRRLGIAALEALHGAGVFYVASAVEGRALAGKDCYVVGGGNSGRPSGDAARPGRPSCDIARAGTNACGEHVVLPTG